MSRWIKLREWMYSMREICGGGVNTLQLNVSREGATTHELVGEEQSRLERELAVAKVEQVLERRPEQVEDHGVVVAFDAEPAHERDADAAGEGLVDLGLVLELRVLGLDGFELDGDFLARDDVDAEVDVAWQGGDRESAPSRSLAPGIFPRVWRTELRRRDESVSLRIDGAEVQVGETHGSGTNLLADAVLATDAARERETIRVSISHPPSYGTQDLTGMCRENCLKDAPKIHGGGGETRGRGPRDQREKEEGRNAVTQSSSAG
jgi:hypothetical protein